MRLNGFFLLGKRIRVKMASYNSKRKSWRIGSDQKVKEQSAETDGELKGEEMIVNNERRDMKTDIRKIQGHVEVELLWNLQKCLVCESILVCDSKSLNDHLAKIGLGKIIVRRIQGKNFSVEIPDKELVELLRQTEWSYLKDFFINIEPWSEKVKLKERVSWIGVSGVPLHCWNYETCKKVAGLWGKLVSIGENLTKVHNFEKIELLISISQTNMIDEVVSLEVGDIIFPIRVRERGLLELKEDSFNSKYSWKKKKEVSISKASSVVNSRPKIQSEGIDSDKTGALMVVNLENGKKSNECQNMMEVDNEEVDSEQVSKEINMGGAAEKDIVLEKALKDVRDMGLVIVEGAFGVSNDGGIKNGSHIDCRNSKNFIPDDLIGPEEGNNRSQENEKNRDGMLEENLDLEEELNRMISSKKEEEKFE
ncbi:hypothetical protein PVK06_006818 [Gossypium arboreum]|uniref:DUF4283 domain-containing protein n=1 Tax=Gossypium arboreum TaxID=29729 RepID=A0ABR0QFK7_GOSAR|nr:hypothetical protein PVK06_006818 [Gossypium arboreum]